ncbi:anthranilate synthase component I family protein [Rubrolithibacter danxiaensis]|uniref:anthranilate synthase component I family protein n=1 Tax=Rubrolithibacter danxiaensis TaxID=3390805 RepID=UPI003BF77E57
MLKENTYQLQHKELFKYKALEWAASFEVACFFDSNGFADPYSAFDVLIAAGSKSELKAATGNAFAELQSFLDSHKSWALGFLSYDLKNETEDLKSSNPDQLHFPDLFFFVPEHLILIKSQSIQIRSENPDEVYENILKCVPSDNNIGYPGQVKQRFERSEYIAAVDQLKHHISVGDIYEINFCQEFYSDHSSVNPVEVYKKLNQISPTPFSNFFRLKDKYILSATPERFLRKRKSKLISQPIKGTAKRSDKAAEDIAIKKSLRENLKEQAENVMIVDLVRNDLTKSAIPNTVKVEELFGIYSFKQVHQMISTVVCEANPLLPVTQLIKNTFPMGSMTGAPKIRSMQLIEQYERTKRGIFSGAVGYFSPDGDFDFNVIIRTLLYNSSSKYLSFQTGSAITFDSAPDKEYEECLLKAKAILEVLQGG